MGATEPVMTAFPEPDPVRTRRHHMARLSAAARALGWFLFGEEEVAAGHGAPSGREKTKAQGKERGKPPSRVTPVRWSGKAAWEAAKPLGFSGVTPAGAVVLAAVEAYEDGSGEPPPSVREPAEARRADALLAVAEAALAAGHADHPTASVAEVSVVIDVDVLADDGEGTFEKAPTASPYTGEGGDGLRHRPCAGP
jgi:hypothetical protein